MLADGNVINIGDKLVTKVHKDLSTAIEFSPDQLIFALDIGTRTVIGLVGVRQDDYFNILAVEVIQHKSRAMLDGQIHDISKVADVAKKVKETLEKQLGLQFSQVAIAAAGRVLKTCQIRVDKKIPEGTEIDSY